MASALSHMTRASAHVSCVNSVGAWVTGVIESNIIRALFEGLVADDPKEDYGHPPGAAVSARRVLSGGRAMLASRG